MAIERLPKLALTTDERREVVLSCDPAVVAAAAASDGETFELLAGLARGDDSPWAFVSEAERFTIRPLTRRELRVAMHGGGAVDSGERMDAMIMSMVRAGLVSDHGDLDDLPVEALTELGGHINRLTTLGKAPTPS